MAVRRIVANIATPDPVALARFYRDVFDLNTGMDMGWIVTLTGEGGQTAQASFMSQGGSDTPVPALSIEVDDIDACLARVRALGLTPDYGPADEPWGVRRFYLRDPAGTLINVLSHRAS
ncbi:MAG: glyoxalase [Pseudooceanicola sp.]|jgi:catechol 2,3-dioxygenase-like lactoylglutathione lyase family enzyme|nr:glyoxalase [Pseudooceanicola sp.]